MQCSAFQYEFTYETYSVSKYEADAADAADACP